jgi:hypothetical protein
MRCFGSFARYALKLWEVNARRRAQRSLQNPELSTATAGLAFRKGDAQVES